MELNTIDQFKQEGYVIIKDFCNVEGLYEYALNRARLARIGSTQTPDVPILGDSQVANTPRIYKDKRMTELQNSVSGKVEQITGLTLLKTHNYYRAYKTGDILRYHSDRISCEISVSLCIGYKADYCWPLCLMTHDEKVVEVELRPGDAVIYRGIELKHWRSKFEGINHVQLFMHWVDAKGAYVDWAEDPVEKLMTGRG